VRNMYGSIVSFSKAVLMMLLLSAPLAAETVVLKAERMLDVESGKIITPAVVVVEGDRIRSVNSGQVPANARVIDLGNVTLLPGLMDMHVHLTMNLDADYRLRTVTEDEASATLRGARNAKTTLLAGFTTVRNVGLVTPAHDLIDVSLSHASDMGWIDAPRIVPCGHALSITGGHIDPDMIGPFAQGILNIPPEDGVADGIDEVVQAVRHQIKYGAKWIKIAATAGVFSMEDSIGAQQYTYEEMKAIVDEAARHGVKVAAHAHGTAGIIAAVKAGVISIEHGSMLNDEAIHLMIEKGTYLVPTTHLADAFDFTTVPPVIRKKAETLIPLAKESVRKAVQAGVKIAFGTDVPVFPHGENAKEFGALVDRGMKPIDAIRTATTNAAGLLGVDDRGVIKEGKLADIIAVTGNPLEDIHVLESVRFVMKGGNIYKNEKN